MDLVIEVENEPGALAKVAAACSDAGVNLAAATCIGAGDRAEVHILVPHAEAARHALAISNQAVTRQIAEAGVDLDLVYVATKNRVVFGSPDLAGLKTVLTGS